MSADHQRSTGNLRVSPSARTSARILALLLGALVALTAVSPAQVTYFVDSIAGNDLASGTSPETAFATLGKVRPLITQGTTVRLRRGSLFREHLNLGNAPLFGITVNAYGDGPRPIIDGADIVPASSWTPTDPAGAPGVFETVVTPGPFAPIVIVQVAENDFRLPRVASLAACAAQPGSSFDQSLGNGTYRVYVHPTTSSLEGRSLAVARRDCIRIWGHQHRVDDLHLRNAVTGTGTLGVFEGDDFRASNLLLENGTYHHMVVSNGTFQNCTFYNLQVPSTVGSVYSLFRNEIAGAWLEFHNCTFIQDLRFAVAAEVAVAHGAAGSTGVPSHILHRGCRFFNFAGPGGIAATGHFTFEECLLSNVRDGFRSDRVRFLRSHWLGDRLDPSADFFLSGSGITSNLQVRDSFIDSFRFFQSPVSAGSHIEFRNCQILAREGMRMNGIPSTLIFENNVFDANWFLDFYNLPIPSNVAWTISSNQFYGGLAFSRGSPPVLYPNGDYLLTAGEHYRLSQWLLDRGQVGNSFLLQSSRRTASLSGSPELQIFRGDRHFEISFATQLGASYQLHTSSDLETWSQPSPARPGNGRELYWIVPIPPDHCGFYRSSGSIP